MTKKAMKYNASNLPLAEHSEPSEYLSILELIRE